MCSRHSAQMGGSVDQFRHFHLGILVSLPTFGILQFVADTRLVDIGDVGTEQFVLTFQFVHLVFELAAAFLHTV